VRPVFTEEPDSDCRQGRRNSRRRRGMYLRASRTSYSHAVSLCSFGLLIACAPALARAQQPAPLNPAPGKALVARVATPAAAATPDAPQPATADTPQPTPFQPASGEAPFATLSTQQPATPAVTQTSSSLQGATCVHSYAGTHLRSGTVRNSADLCCSPDELLQQRRLRLREVAW
jgi:hypothetical protein